MQVLLEYLANRKICTKFVSPMTSVTVTTYGYLSRRVRPISLCRYWTDLCLCVLVPQRARWSENFRCDMRDRVKFVA